MHDNNHRIATRKQENTSLLVGGGVSSYAMKVGYFEKQNMEIEVSFYHIK